MGAIGLVVMWRNVAWLVAPIADVNNAVLPVWLIVWGGRRGGRGGRERRGTDSSTRSGCWRGVSMAPPPFDTIQAHVYTHLVQTVTVRMTWRGPDLKSASAAGLIRTTAPG